MRGSSAGLVPKLDAVIGQLDEAITSAGGHAEKVLDPSDAEVPTPESHPDDSAMMNWMHSGWPHVASLVFWVLLFIATITGSRNPIWLVVVGVLIVFSSWRALAGFRRRARIKAARRGRH